MPLKLAVEHSRRVAAFVAGCATGNLELVRAGLDDVLVEPQRERLLPALPEVKAAALEAGALGCSFSGSGPSVFAWVAGWLRRCGRAGDGRCLRASRHRGERLSRAGCFGRGPGVRRRRRARRRMRFVSTRGNAAPTSLSEALLGGAAPDGGLYMPEVVPPAQLAELASEHSLADFAADGARPFFEGDPLEGELAAICEEAFDFPVPIASSERRPTSRSLELFHGPTGAFKDFGARFLMACFDRVGRGQPLTVLAATSGDTGGAVGCAAEGRAGVEAIDPLSERSRFDRFRSGSSPAGATRCERSRSTATSTIASALSKAAFARSTARCVTFN